MQPPSTPAANPPQASGRAFLGIIKHVRDTHGAAELAAAVKDAGPATQAAFAGRILHSGWYPYEAFAKLLAALETRFGKGAPDYCKKLGMATGIQDINTVFRIYLALASPERLIRGCSKVWPTYYKNAGQMEATAWAPERTTLRIMDFKQMAPAHCRLMEGWMIATMDAIGLKVHGDGRETRCTSRGDLWHEFSCSWSRKG